jgi:hypothetical protein
MVTTVFWVIFMGVGPFFKKELSLKRAVVCRVWGLGPVL